MSTLDVKTIKQALKDAGVEIYRSRPDEVQIAERIRLHIMDSGVRVVLAEGSPRVRFTARSQRSDFPNADGDALFARVRERVGAPAQERGYTEHGAQVHEVKDPVDEAKTLDVWHEVVYEKAAEDVGALVDEVRWAVELEKYVAD
ncbi:MAG TPA: hypothetical protein RMH85_20100 [Polyangiaceae bacterium LLY-WYZ-15_(1-7)]|nr:hypothetical protein [Sandaracinus sp.]HJL06319.1 hypothetical protein [Polyangiaceae bacterium LLY-WYZ-15_(1-7)]MBJ73171.1 hypothetical protein [Sandaracinus sp.]HJL10786.1 hypothetical protein [Polyangiaceae bacterium LLY-WYZ-15_(1-7)]HJL20966.1 hypothetical protein [Polyangiaceae bacterium LLY-WYZ-15_(1-7)]